MRALKSGQTIGRILVFSAFLVLVTGGLSSCAKKESPQLLVYTYDSFASEWGAGPKLAPLFEKKTGITVVFVAKGDGGQLLSTLILEKGKANADLAIGIDNFLAARALDSGLFQAYEPKGIDAIPSHLRIDATKRLTPYDFGHFAIIWDSQKLKIPPKSLADLASPSFAKKLILMDPRSSTPGLGFLAWTEAVYGDDWREYWRSLKPNVLALAPGWDMGYGLFTSGEAPLVLSYATSPAYHKEYDKTDRYVALPFPEGYIAQIEFAGILADAPRTGNARKFLDFLVSVEGQNLLPLTQWMQPVNPAASLPESWSAALRPEKTVSVDAARPAADAIEAAEILSADSSLEPPAASGR